MARPPARPDRFTEAVAWFRARVPVGDKDYARLTDAAKRQAFKVAGVTQLELARDIWDSLSEAIDQGTSLKDWRKQVRAQLAKNWEEPSATLDTIFRTNVQHAYSAGRFAQMDEPAVRRARPLWRFSAILDSRTTDICRPLDGLVRPSTDPWWTGHYPPLHFNCRSTVVSLAAGEDVDDTVPAVDVPEGFGRLPQVDDWHPDLSAFPAALVQAHHRRVKPRGGISG